MTGSIEDEVGHHQRVDDRDVDGCGRRRAALVPLLVIGVVLPFAKAAEAAEVRRPRQPVEATEVRRGEAAGRGEPRSPSSAVVRPRW
jgi:hypothetical protein